MRRFGYNVIYLVQLIRYFGPIDGVSIFCKILFSRSLSIISSKKFKNKVEIRKQDSDLPIFYQVFADLQYDISFSLKYTPLRIIDCGANVGYASLYFSSLFPSAEIIAVEPDNKNFIQLSRNTQNYKNITAVKAAVWHRNTEMVIKNKSQLSAGFEVEESGSNDNVELIGITIDEVIAKNNFEEVDILKIDIEGAEYELFTNNPHSWLSKTRCLIIELHDNLKPGISKHFFKEMAEYNWRTVIRGENIICFKEH